MRHFCERNGLLRLHPTMFTPHWIINIIARCLEMASGQPTNEALPVQPDVTSDHVTCNLSAGIESASWR